MTRYHFYLLLVPLYFLLLSCAGPKSLTELILPQGLDSSFRSGQVKSRSLTNKLQVLEYRAISDSFKKSAYKDSMLTFGLIIPRSYLVASASVSKMLFGSDSLQCTIDYADLRIYTATEQGSLLSEIIRPRYKRKPGYDPEAKTNTPLKRMVAGTIQIHPVKDLILFSFEHGPTSKDFDSSHIAGYIKSGSDSMFIRPLFKEIPLHGKNVKPMQILQGYSLMKGDTLYAFLQHAPLVKSKDTLFLNSKASTDEQLLMAAYFSLVSRLVLSTSNELLY